MKRSLKVKKKQKLSKINKNREFITSRCAQKEIIKNNFQTKEKCSPMEAEKCGKK